MYCCARRLEPGLLCTHSYSRHLRSSSIVETLPVAPRAQGRLDAGEASSRHCSVFTPHDPVERCHHALSLRQEPALRTEALEYPLPGWLIDRNPCGTLAHLARCWS